MVCLLLWQKAHFVVCWPPFCTGCTTSMDPDIYGGHGTTVMLPFTNGWVALPLVPPCGYLLIHAFAIYFIDGPHEVVD